MRDKRLFVVERGDLKTKLCESCGKLIKIKSNRQKYCEKCATDINNQKTKEKMKELYEKSKIL